MLTETQAREVIGSTAYSQDGEKLGKVGQLFLDDQTGQPEFVTVNTGLFGTSESFVPVASATFEGGRFTVPFGKDQVKGAPHVDLDGGHLDESEERRLYEHYGMGASYDTGRTGNTGDAGTTGHPETVGYASSGTDTGTRSGKGKGTGTGTGNVTPAGHDTSGPNTDDAMTRSEEHVNVGTRSEESGRVRLRKYVTTETETHTVPVRKEHVVVEREPVTDANVGAAHDGPAISEEEHEVVLHEERPVVEKNVEAVERVRLGTETEVAQESVTEEVRKEHVEVEDDTDRRR